MENEKENKLGKGILILSILHILGSISAIYSSLTFDPSSITPEMESLLKISADSMKDSMKASFMPTMIISIVMIVACILILLKNKIGIFLYLLVVLANILMPIALNQFKVLTLILTLILPVLMAIFITKKKELYGFATK